MYKGKFNVYIILYFVNIFLYSIKKLRIFAEFSCVGAF